MSFLSYPQTWWGGAVLASTVLGAVGILTGLHALLIAGWGASLILHVLTWYYYQQHLENKDDVICCIQELEKDMEEAYFRHTGEEGGGRDVEMLLRFTPLRWKLKGIALERRDEDPGRAVAVVIPVGFETLWAADVTDALHTRDVFLQIVSECCQQHSGVYQWVISDEYCLSFPHESHALGFSISLQHTFNTTTWGDTPVTSRIGVASGTPPSGSDFISRLSRVDGDVVVTARKVLDYCAVGCVAATSDVLQNNRDLRCVSVGTLRLRMSLVNVSVVVPEWEADREDVIRSSIHDGVVSVDTTSPLKRPRTCFAKSHPGFQLTTSRITAGAVAIQYDTDQLSLTPRTDDGSSVLSQNLDAVITLVHRTHGSTICLLSNILYIQWGLTTGCPEYIENAINFASRLPPTTYEIGLCNGVVQQGILGRGVCLFQAALGLCLGMSGSLAGVSVKLVTGCLISTIPGEDQSPHTVPRIQRCLRPIDTWTVEGSSMCVYQFAAEPPSCWSWSRDYWECFCMSDYLTIGMNAEIASDPILKMVAANFKSGLIFSNTTSLPPDDALL